MKHLKTLAFAVVALTASTAFADGDAHMAHVKPGAQGGIVWQFTQAGAYQFACLIPGHVEAGMVGKVVVK